MIKLENYFNNFVLGEETLFNNYKKTIIEFIGINGRLYPKYVNEFWTSKQRKSNSIHEIAFRACFKAQLPGFFIKLLSNEGDVIYDPFSGRGTTIIEAGLLNRNIISNDVNPLSKILAYPRLFVPDIEKLKKRLDDIEINYNLGSDIDLSMFYHPKTLAELLSFKEYLSERVRKIENDHLDNWLRMIATNRLTGHSKGYFSVYTLPPNQAVSPASQIRINKKRNQEAEYRNVKEIILKKSISLIRDLNHEQKSILSSVGERSLFLTGDARYTKEIEANSVQLTVTSPPFLDIVQYASDNWLRCWFNNIDAQKIGVIITMSKKINDWCEVMGGVLKELYRITKKNGWVAFEVGEVKNKKINLDEFIVPLGVKAGFNCEGIVINSQEFTKTSSIWGIKNNHKGTNTNRIVLFNKG